MNRVGRTSGILAAAGLVVLALFVVPAMAVPVVGSAAPMGSTSPQQWAYGAQKWVNVTIDFPNATYTQHAFFGWQVIFTATNTSNTTQSWEVERTVGADFFAQYCQPNCSAPTAYGNLTVLGLEHDAGFANLTDTATVYVNGSAVPAVGLVNASFENAASLNETMRYGLTSGPITGNASGAFDITGAAHGAVGFTPALGLVPENLSGPEFWNSSSAFSASGGWSVTFAATHTPFHGTPTSSSASANGSVAASGTVAISGGDFGTITLANGQNVPVVGLTWSGPFDVVDGVILIPHDFDLFGGGLHSWGDDELGSEDFATSSIDVHFDAAHHLQVVAAATAYTSQDSTLDVSSGPTTMETPATSSSSPAVVQAQPESVAQAQSSAACLSGACTATSSASKPLTSGVVALVVVAVAAVALVGLILAVRGRRGGGGPSPPTGAYGSPAGVGTNVPAPPPRP